MSDKPVIHMVDPKTLVPYEHNALKHSQAQIDKLAGLISAFGFDQPIVVDRDGVIVKGHGRREAAIRLKLAEVPVIISDLSEQELAASRLADNKSRSLEYDEDMLRFELGTLKRNNFNLQLTGLDTGELEEHMAALEDQAVKQVSPPVAQRSPPPEPPPPGPVTDLTEEAKEEARLEAEGAAPHPQDQEEEDDGLSVDGDDEEPVEEDEGEVLSGGAGGLSSTPFLFLTFGDTKLAVMQSEVDDLSGRLTAYKAEHGTMYGFVKHLLKL